MNEHIKNFGVRIERKDLSGQHDPASVSMKYTMLPQKIRDTLDNSLEKIGLNFAQCFSPNYLSTLNEEQRKKLSSLNGDLNMGSDKETIENIINLLR